MNSIKTVLSIIRPSKKEIKKLPLKYDFLPLITKYTPFKA